MAGPVTKFKLNTGAEIPALGLGSFFIKHTFQDCRYACVLIRNVGTWQSKPGEVRAAVRYALENGYRHIDAAYCYGNEEEVGLGLRDVFSTGNVRREDVFVTSKLWCTYHTRVEKNLDQSLKTLGLDYLDLYLVHWPVAMNPDGESPRICSSSR
jgi:glycerol 2-dehydrogenase (NADP+)